MRRAQTYISVASDILVIVVLPPFLDNEMSPVSDFLTILPGNKRPSELGDQIVFHFPSFEIYGQPCACLLSPEPSQFFEN